MVLLKPPFYLSEKKVRKGKGMGALIWIARIELKTLAWGYTAESLWWGTWGKMERMGFCCQSLENPLLMEWEKAEKDCKSKAGEEGISHRWVWVNSYKDNALFVCVFMWEQNRLKQMEQSQKASNETSLQAAPELLCFWHKQQCRRGRADYFHRAHKSPRHTTTYTRTQQSYTGLIWFSGFIFEHELLNFCFSWLLFSNMLKFGVYWACSVCLHSWCPPYSDNFWTVFVD